MKITHINTFDIQGGAAIAAYRLHQGLLKIGQESQMLTRYKTSQDNTVFEVKCSSIDHKTDFNYSYCIEKHYIYYNRTSLTNTLFSLGYLGFNLDELPQLKNSDIINLHWVANDFQSHITIKKLLELGKPVIWTLHDMAAFTGGCHYSARCDKYQTDCLNCPQLVNDIYGLTQTILEEKATIFNHPNLTIVTPSKWLGECAKKSRVFGKNSIKVIPSSLDTNIFKPIPKTEAKINLTLSPDNIILLIGAISSKEKRKGFDELIEVFKICQENTNFNQLVNDNTLKICAFGESMEDLNQLNLSIFSFGVIDSEETLSLIYSAADMFILPSLEDNLPNTMIEAMSCGTPVIAFEIGGIPDLVTNSMTGFTAPEKNLQVMAKKIIQLIENKELRQQMSNQCRQLIVDNYSLENQANNYLNLYQNLLNTNNNLSHQFDREFEEIKIMYLLV